jgi:hypothetical protein
MGKKKSNYYGENSYYKNTHPAEIYLLPNISISFMAKAISVLELTNNVVSSANWDILIMCAFSSILTFIPLIFLFSLFFCYLGGNII